jgi:hypothetical protein
MPQYQGVWTLEQQAQAQSNQQWVTDPNFKNTTLLLQADGTGSGSQNNTFLDGSTNNFFITRNGNTTQGSFSPFSQAPGYWGNYFDGTDDDLSIASNVNLTPAAGDFTLECWIFPTSWASLGSYRSVIGGPVSGCMFFGQTSTGFGLRALAVADVVVTTTLPPTNAWTHVAVSRSGTSARLFINGALVATATDSTNFAQTQVVIANTSVAGTEEYSGYISNLRFIKGTALYTSAFTPQTSPLTAVTNTQLLICQSNRFVDNSANAFSLSVGGTPSVQAFGPFAPALQWTPDVVGGSGYFDGSGDVLTVPSNSAFDFAGNVTIEFWIYFTGNMGVRQDLIHHISNGFEILKLSGDTIYCGFGGGTITSSITVKAGQWYHIALVRSSTGANGLNLYINGVNVGSSTAASSVTSGTMAIGAQATGGQPTSGYFSSLRIVKGTAVYTTAFTPPTAPVTAITNTSLLLNFTNAGIYDGKMANVVETAGNAQVATNPVKYGSGSISFGSGTANYLTYLNNPGFVFGTGDFTVEFWVNTFDSTACLLRFSTGTTGYWQMAFSVSSIVWQNSQDTSNLYVASCPQAFNGQWHHIAVTRTGGINRLFFDGTLLTSAADTTNYSGSAGYMQIGWDGSNQFTGFMDDLRITKGVARYIANFTPPQQALPRQ